MIPVGFGDVVSNFYRAAIAEHPQLAACSEFEIVGLNQSPTITFRSPLDDRLMDIQVWISDGDLSISFAYWHTHGGYWPMTDGLSEDAAILLLLRKIMGATLVASIDSDGEHAGFRSIIDLDDFETVWEALTHKWSPTQIRVISWDGSVNRVIDAKTLS